VPPLGEGGVDEPRRQITFLQADRGGDLYKILAEVTKSYNSELKTLEPYSPQAILAGQAVADYMLVRGLIESTEGSYGFVTEGRMTAPPALPGNITDQKSFEGWRKLP
jgi:hypothetical protein